MTVAEIKEYIDNAIETAFAQKIAIDTAEILKKALIDTKYMLDELEPKAKWVKTPLSYYDEDYGYECSNCKEIYCTEYDFEEMAYNYCPNCGARINDEVDNESSN